MGDSRIARWLLAPISLSGLFCAPLLNSQTVNVTTWHNDNWRTGQNTNETTLTTSLVGNVNQFGKICSASAAGTVLDGDGLRSILIVTNEKFSSSPVIRLAY